MLRVLMSRVEPKPTQAPREAEQGRRQPVDRTPAKTKGDERTSDEALKNDARRGSRVADRE
jgi:hypothetical protein